MKKHIIKIALVLSAAILTIACNNDDDATGAATISATSPSLSVALDFADSQSLVEQEASYGFTVTLSEPQIVDVRVYLKQISGTASLDADYSMPSNVTIPAGKTSVSDVITLHADDLIEETETAVIQIGTGLEANVANVSSQTISFSIMNLVEGDLGIGMSWETSAQVTDNFGNELDAYTVADLRLLITDVPYTQILDGADGGSAESYLLDGASTPDGEYYVVADFYSAIPNISVDLNITLSFDQVGVINGQTLSFPAALNTGNSCSSVYNILAKITKTGESYTFTSINEPSPVSAAPFVGTATITADDWADYELGETIEIEAGANSQEFWIRSYTNPYIANPDTAYMIVTLDPATGAATVASNEPFDYGVPINVSGSGVVNACSGEINLTLNFTRPSDGAFYARNQAFNLKL